MERRIISEYQALIAEILEGVTAENYDLAVELASVPDLIRGYGHIKERNVFACRRSAKAELLRKMAHAELVRRTTTQRSLQPASWPNQP